MISTTLKTSLAIALAATLAAPVALAGSKTQGCRTADDLSRDAMMYMAASPDNAVNKLKMAVEHCPESASIRYNLGLAQYQSGKPQVAIDSLEEAIRLNPNYGNALNALAYLMHTTRTGAPEKAIELAQKAVRLEPNNAEFQDTLAQVQIADEVDRPVATGLSRPDAVAVVIGNKGYRAPGLPDVEYAQRDAEVMKEYLMTTFGFQERNIIYVTDAALVDFKKIFGDERNPEGQLFNRVRPGRSDVFIYYSGHGAPDPDSKDGYFIPANADPSAVRFTAYSLDTFYANLRHLEETKHPRSIVVAMDACFSGSSNAGMIIPGASPVFVEVKQSAVQLPNTVVLSSSQGDQVSSWYPEKRHGLFTYYLLENIRKNAASGKPLSAGELADRITDPYDGVNDMALQLYNRNQNPTVVGDRRLLLLDTHR